MAIKLDRTLMTVFGAGLRIPGIGLVPVGVVVALPDFSQNLKFFRGGWGSGVLLTATGIALLSGLLLTLLRSGSEGTAGDLTTIATTLLWLLMIVITAVSLARPLCCVTLGDALPILGIGSAIGTYIFVQPERNAWKYALAYGVVVFLMSVGARRGVLLTFGIGLCLCVFSIAQGARSVAVIIAFSLVVMLLARNKPNGNNKESAVTAALVLVVGAAFASITWFFLQAMRLGWLGDAIRESYDEQTTGDQFILLGGRLEWRAALALFLSKPLGYGVGAVPETNEIRSAVAAATQYRGSYRDPYFSSAVFSDRVDLHSAVTNLWFHFGAGGVLLALVVVAVIARGILDSLTLKPAIVAPVVFILVFGLWDLFFSPMMQFDHIGFAIALSALVSRNARLETGPVVPFSKATH